jgi:RNA polymerase sigma-70 factor (ECF subfamily)
MEESKQKQIFDTWLHDHKGLFFKIVRAYAFTANDQDDLFQEICIQVWKSIPNFRGEAKASTWIYRVALYAAMAWSRKERKHDDKTKPLADVAQTLIAINHEIDSRLDWLYTQIGQLNEVDRSICLLMLDGYRYGEIAELMGITSSNVGVKIHRIKQHLVRTAKQEMITNGEHHGI